MKKYSLCVKSHTVYEIRHILQDSTGVRFALNMEKDPLTLRFLGTLSERKNGIMWEKFPN